MGQASLIPVTVSTSGVSGERGFEGLWHQGQFDFSERSLSMDPVSDLFRSVGTLFSEFGIAGLQ